MENVNRGDILTHKYKKDCKYVVIDSIGVIRINPFKRGLDLTGLVELDLGKIRRDFWVKSPILNPTVGMMLVESGDKRFDVWLIYRITRFSIRIITKKK